jgi:hypothetical protein
MCIKRRRLGEISLGKFGIVKFVKNQRIKTGEMPKSQPEAKADNRNDP